jgi:hypothetical protein
VVPIAGFTRPSSILLAEAFAIRGEKSPMCCGEDMACTT